MGHHTRRQFESPEAAAEAAIANRPRQFETLEAAAARLSLDKRTIRRAIAAGRLHGYRFGARALRVEPAEVDALMEPVPTVERSA
jgi:excisionase family DNA binding protein